MIQRDLKRTSFKHLKLVNVFLMVQKDLNGMSFKRLKLVYVFLMIQKDLQKTTFRRLEIDVYKTSLKRRLLVLRIGRPRKTAFKRPFNNSVLGGQE